MQVRKGVMAAAVAALLVAGGAAAWLTRGEPPPSDQGGRHEAGSPLPIHAAAAHEAHLEDSVAYTAIVTSPQVVQLHPRVTGIITQRPFRPGSQVSKGDLLFRVDPRPFEASLAQDTAQRAQAAATLAFAQKEVERYRPLQKRGFASVERLQQEERDRDVASAQVSEAEARMMRDRLDIQYSTITAPFDGQAGITDVNVGDLASANQTSLVSLAQLDPIDVQVALSSADLARVRQGMGGATPPEVALLGPDGTPDGRVAQIVEFDNQFNPRTARLLVRARLPNPERTLAPGDFLHVRLRLGLERRLLVPTVALSYRLDQELVFVVSDGGVQPRVVEGTEQFGDNTAITKGLKPGDVVATDNIGRLHAGQKVTVREDEGSKERTTENASAKE